VYVDKVFLNTADIIRSNYKRNRLKLNDALKDTDSMEGWSPARIRVHSQYGYEHCETEHCVAIGVAAAEDQPERVLLSFS